MSMETETQSLGGYPPPPMKEPRTVSCDLGISDNDLQKLKTGLVPYDQDDKWYFATTGPDDAGIISFHIIRYFSHRDFYIIHVKPSDDVGGDQSTRRHKIQSFTWDENQCGIYMTEEQGKKQAVSLWRSHLECEFEELPEEDFSSDWMDYSGYDLNPEDPIYLKYRDSP
ncbi:uncharacterized protein PgNI_02228 [Pyricularia grisea]|uniref:Uncharacterized protein n=1 Tax=Pyricularia grisea TaxID=148305 RepID=A0A6P8BH00_PYRGI|nr:uncharacterized protein PgNI_02228 [Pyricularia grisea]TLD16053.1 hypothetical protein PgNI_02228 [Pyricularia grisea]